MATGKAAERGTGIVTLLRAGDVRGLVGRYSDLALAALVVGIVGMMIVPLPPLLLDLMISLNLGVAVMLLLVAIYVGDALKIAAFPTILLLTTLYRLALQVSATRLILLRADAGEVIQAFGSFVVAGNLVVGAVIFLILTVIQLVVITKGAERVAEVAARFTLDAMPGKQMAIDAELRAGHIDAEEARRRRAHLGRESQLFGAMDGAMKFVKGDAVAGLVVLAVNIVGGLVIGVLQRGMAIADAARTYTVLTVGEGLVAQLPALVISTAAGIIVTRVASDEQEGSHLGREIGAQVLAHPRAIAVTAGLLVVLALVPGLPLAPFLALAAVLGLAAFALLRVPGGAAAGTAARAGGGTGAGRRSSGLPAPLLAPIAVELGVPHAEGTRIADLVGPLVRERLFAELGIPIGDPEVRAAAPGLGPGAYVLRLGGVPLGRGQVVPDSDGAAPAIAEHLMALLRRHGHELVGIEETQALLAALERTHPALVREVVPKLCSTALLADVLRRLAAEGISLRHIQEVLGAIAERAPQERDPALLTEHARASLRRLLTHRHAGPDGTLAVYLLDPAVEDTIREAIHATSAGSVLALEPQLGRDIVRAVGRASAARAPGGAAPVILAAADIRRHVRRLIEAAHPDLAVLSHPELAPEIRVEVLARISPQAEVA